MKRKGLMKYIDKNGIEIAMVGFAVLFFVEVCLFFYCTFELLNK